MITLKSCIVFGDGKASVMMEKMFVYILFMEI